MKILAWFIGINLGIIISTLVLSIVLPLIAAIPQPIWDLACIFEYVFEWY